MENFVARFPSLTRKFGYAFHTDSMALWDSAYRASGALGPGCGEFPTFGDGLTQHGTEYAVTRENFADYCASLAAHVLAEMGRTVNVVAVGQRPALDHDFSEALAHRWPTPEYSDEKIRFAFTVVHKEHDTKRMYFSTDELKVKTVTIGKDQLQHDRRWHLVTESMDGSVKSAIEVLRVGATVNDRLPTWYILEAYATVNRVIDIGMQLDSETRTSGSRGLPGSFLGFVSRDADVYDPAVNEVLYKAHAAWLQADHVFTALKLLSSARRGIDSWKRNHVKEAPAVPAYEDAKAAEEKAS